MTTLHLRGEFDIATLPDLEKAVRRAVDTGLDVVVDLGELTFIDAAGLHVLAAAAGRARQGGRRLRLERATPHVRRLLVLLGLDELAG